jgi:hypothetical protein
MLSFRVGAVVSPLFSPQGGELPLASTLSTVIHKRYSHSLSGNEILSKFLLTVNRDHRPRPGGRLVKHSG